jgi:hypothetical protein
MKKRLVLVASIVLLATLGLAPVYAETQTSPATTQILPSWQLLLSYLIVGGLFGLIHDVNDKKGIVILPHQIFVQDKPTGQWDLGVLSPALFGAGAGFIAQYIGNTPILDAFFPPIAGKTPGLLAAALAGYLYSKLFEALASSVQATASKAAAC